MIQLLILALCNNTIMLVLYYKWRVVERYQAYRRSWLPDWCDLCFYFWCGMVEYTFLNINGIISFYLIFSVFVHSMAVCFVSLTLDKLYHKI